MEVRYEPYETANEKAEDRYEPNETAFKNEGASDAPESGQKKFSPEDVQKI